MTNPIRLSAPLYLSLSDAIRQALDFMDRSHKNAMGNQIELKYVFDFHGLEVDVHPALSTQRTIATDVRDLMAVRSREYDALEPKSSHTVMFAPPMTTGTVIDRIWLRNAVLLFANGARAQEPDVHRFYAVNWDRQAVTLNPWSGHHSLGLDY